MSQINESAIATPGVYVTEIPSFPPSVAQVATAIPAFVGYTAQATNLQPGDLLNVPTRLSSLIEFQSYFGGAPDPGITEVDIDSNNVVTNIKRSATYYMYDSIRMFFLNGGGACYIISIGLFPASVSAGDYQTGFAALAKYDEPTLIVIPDAVLLGSPNLYPVQVEALQLCGQLQDRFCIFDLIDQANLGNELSDFRNNTGVANLNYGAAYAPYLKTSLGLTVAYKNLKGKIFQAGVAIDLKNFTTSTDAQNLITSYNNLIDDTTTVNADIATVLTNSNLDTEEEWIFYVNSYLHNFTTSPLADHESDFEHLFNYMYSVAKLLDKWGHTVGGLNGDYQHLSLKQDVTNLVTALIPSMSKLIAYDRGADVTFTTGGYYTSAGRTALLATFNDTLWGGVISTPPAADHSIYGASPAPAATAPSERMGSLTALTNLYNQFDKAVTQVINLTASYQATYEQNLLQQHPIYKSIVTAVQNSSTTLPPSGAIAGVYATVDGTRGVWKAPANVSLTGVTGLTYNVTDADQGTMNIDPMSGKSVNAIRAFTGAGILVWGARTLDGNSNDFRYVSVRRFLIMVEESVKLAARQFVFEPNDGNTWVRVRAMIENYLTNLWRQGALAGAKPEQSFYVKVGLGQTMIFDDILNGKMIIEIGLAPVRPAEFIILRFTQIQQTS